MYQPLLSCCPVDSIRYIENNDTLKTIRSHDDSMLKDIADALGVYPNTEVKALVFVEGPNDVVAIKNFSRIISEQNSSIVNLKEKEEIIIVPLGGSTLKDWVQNQYLKKLGCPEIRIYDRDDADKPKYMREYKNVNERNDGSKGFITSKREIENYIHKDAIKNVLDVEVEFDDEDDVSTLVAMKIHESCYETSWEDVKDKKKKDKGSRAKKRLNLEVIPTLTYQQICEMDNDKEIEGWLEEITKIASGITISS